MKNLFQLYVFGVRIIVIFAFCSLGISNAVAQEGEVQESHPLLEEGKVWNYDFSYVEINFNRNQDSCTYWIDGDTIVDGKRLFHECVFDSNGFCAPSYETEANCCPDNNHPHAIDLGLPSGTKWACCNVGATKPEEYGGYYAWGEIEEKEIYYWNTYIHCDGTEATCHNIGSDIAGTQYDVAHEKWGGTWQMPSFDQNEELINNCTSEYTTLNGVKSPTVCAPGAMIVSSVSHFDKNYKDEQSAQKQTVNGTDYYWATLSGTSMSTPHATGIIALWLQANPRMTRKDIFDVLAKSSIPCDKPQEQERWGQYGKIDALAGLKYVLQSSDVRSVEAEEALLWTDVYNLNGQLIRKRVATESALEGLPAGIYVADGRKVIVKK